jgi:putative MATE family efflux protein
LIEEWKFRMTKDNDLTTGPIPRLIARLAIPASIGYFFNTMYNVVDTFFGGLISTQVLAALSLSLPIFFIIIAMGTGIATGTTALIANALGAEERERAALYAVQGIAFGLLTGVAVALFGVFSSPVLFSLLGASDEYLSICLAYMNTIFLGTIFFMMVYMLNSILYALGDTRSFRNFLIAGFLLNILLDPWFIYGGIGLPAMGIAGIAVATVLIQIIGCIYLGIKVFRTRLLSGKTLKDILPVYGMVKEIAQQGLPASVNMITVGVGFFVITYFVSKFGEEAVAAYGIGIRIEQIALLPSIGLNVATLTLVAQNNGARLFDRVREILNAALAFGGILMIAATILVFLLARYLMVFFTDDVSVIEIGTTYIRIDCLVFYAYVILFTNIAALQGVKKPMFAVWIGLFRQLVAPLVVFYALINILEVGLLGIWWGFFSITWSAAIFSIFYTRVILRDVINLALVEPSV